jgi:O-antigen/teichoic acid export membrane protein
MKNYWVKSGLYTFLQRFVTLIFGFGGFYLLIRMQSKNDFGIWALVISITALLEVARNGLIQNGLIKYSIGADKNEEAEIQSATLFLNVILTVLSCCFLYFSSSFFESIWHSNDVKSLLKIYCLTSIVLIPFQQFSYIQQAKFDFKALFFMYLLRQGSFFFVILFHYIYFHQIGLLTLGWWLLISSILSSILGFYMSKKYLLTLKKPTFKWVKLLFNYGKFSFGTNISGMLLNSIDQIMLGAMTGASNVAIYNASCKINNLIEVPISTMASIVFPQTTLKANLNDTESIKVMYEKSVSILLALILPVLILVSLMPTFIMRLIAGVNFSGYPEVLLIILLFSVFQPFMRQFGTVMDSLGKPNINFYCISFSVILNLCLNYLFIPVWGIHGAAISTVISLFISVVINFYILKKFIDIKMYNILIGIIAVYRFMISKVLFFFNLEDLKLFRIQ